MRSFLRSWWSGGGLFFEASATARAPVRAARIETSTQLLPVRAEPVEAIAPLSNRSVSGFVGCGYRVPVFRAGAGSRPACEVLFFASPKKSTQKKGDPQSATPSLCEGADLRRGGCGARRGTRFAAAQRRSDNHGESDHEAAAHLRDCHPETAPAQAQPEGGGAPNSRTATRVVAALDPAWAAPVASGAWLRLRPRSWAERSKGPNGCPLPIPSVCAEERRAWGGVCRRTHASWTDSLRLSERSAAGAQRVPQRAPRTSTAGCPEAKRRGRRQWGRPFFGDFLLASQKKVTRTPGDSRPPP